MIALSRPSFLQQRLETTQPFVVVGNQLYEIHTSERLSKNRLHFLDKDHPLVEAGQLSSHERSFLDANRTSLERAAMQILIDKKREINGISAGISDLERAIQGDAAEKFVVDNAGTYYLSMQDPRIVHPGRARKQLSATEIPELRMRPFDSLLFQQVTLRSDFSVSGNEKFFVHLGRYFHCKKEFLLLNMSALGIDRMLFRMSDPCVRKVNPI